MSTRNSNIQQVSNAAPVGALVGDTWFNPTTNRQYQLLPVNGTTVQWAEVPTGANGYGAVTASPNVYTALQSFIGSNSSLGLSLNNAAERISFFGIGANGTINYDIANQSVLYYIGNAGSNWTLNFRASEGVSLNSVMAIGQAVTVVFLANQSTTAYFSGNVRVDGTTYTPAWQGGTAPTSGTTSGTDLYSYTIVKTNEFSFIVFASRTAYGTPVFVTNPPGVGQVGLYEMNSAITFTPGGTTGRDGPSLAAARAGLTGTGTETWKNNISFFNVTDGIQYWTVPRTGSYTIEAFGGQGGNAGGQQGGRGARVQGSFSLTEGEIIRILVGQQGQSGPHTQDGQPMGAGGGGTYVIRSPYNTTGSILLIAGGGGGAAQNSWSNAAGIGGSASNNGTNGGGGVSGGTGGNGGNGGDGSGSGPGGAGFTGNGAVDPLSGNPAGDNAKSFTNGGRGGRKSFSWGGSEIFGGFGGGGGGGGLACGGGGGYSGGGGGTWSSPQQGGGGGSFNSGSSAINEAGGTGSATRSGPGQVIITPPAPAGGGTGGGGGGSPALFSFTTFTFTSAGTVGRFGPTLSTLQSSYSAQPWASNTSFFSQGRAQGYQVWQVPQDGIYEIECAGARGQDSSSPGTGRGRGAIIRAHFSLLASQKLEMVVGQVPGNTGSTNPSNSYAGAGGGSFVVIEGTNTPVIIAGGGGGSWSTYPSQAIVDGQTRQRPRWDGFSYSPAVNGTDPGLGQGGLGYHGGGGGGLLSPGQDYSGWSGSAAMSTGAGGQNFTHGAAFIGGGVSNGGGNFFAIGGNATALTSEGGFGGGGGGHSGNNTGGGGGGYSGGVAGQSSLGGSVLTGTGGGSFIRTGATNIATSDGLFDGISTFGGLSITNLGLFNDSGGYIKITRVS